MGIIVKRMVKRSGHQSVLSAFLVGMPTGYNQNAVSNNLDVLNNTVAELIKHGLQKKKIYLMTNFYTSYKKKLWS